MTPHTSVYPDSGKVGAWPPGKLFKLADAVDYDMLYRTVREVVEGESFHLLEALAARLADIILERFGIQRVCVRIAKQNLGWTTGGRAIIEVTRDRGAGGAGAARSSKETA